MPSEPIIGIDEAGRGPVLGPLVVGIVVWDSPQIPDGIRITDSKKMTALQRTKARQFIQANCEYMILCIPAWTISKSKYPIQILQGIVISDGLNSLNNTYDVICDALSSGQKLYRWLRKKHNQRDFTFESKADLNYPAVSAASILAKSCRDRCMERIKETWGNVGSGYPADPYTQDWLKKKRGETWPAFVRTSWSTIQKLTSRHNPRNLPVLAMCKHVCTVVQACLHCGASMSALWGGCQRY